MAFPPYTHANDPLISNHSIKKPLPYFFKFLKYWIAPHKFYFWGACFALVMAAGSVLALGGVVRHLVDQGLNQLNTVELHRTLLYFMLTVSILAVSSAGRFYFTALLGKRLLRQLRLDLFQKILLSTTIERKNWNFESLQEINKDLNSLEQWISSQFSVSLRNILLIIGGIALLFHSSFKLTILFLILIPALITPILILTRQFRLKVKKQTIESDHLAAFFDEHLRALPIIQSLNYEDKALLKLSERSSHLLQVQKSSLRGRSALVASIMFVVFGGIACILWIGGHDALQGTLSKGTLSAFVLYAMMVAGALGALSDSSEELRRVANATLRLQEWLSLPDHTMVNDTANSQAHLNNHSSSEHYISFDRVTFKYPDRNQNAIYQLSLSIKKGEKIAIVGASGAGKSTLFQLLLGFQQPASGTISVLNTQVTLYNAPVVRKLIAWVNQDPVLFSTSIKENLLYGNPDATEEQLSSACKAANLDQWIQSLNDGFNTPIGNLNLGVSGGQKQRIALARAMLADRPILLLDEATSALDAENEHSIQEAIERLSSGRTVVTIAHRLSTIRASNRIVLMDQGCIVDIGTHAELLERQALYNRFVSLQTARSE